MMKKSLLALTAVAFVAMMAFAQDIKTAVSKSQSGEQTSGYVKKDVKKKTDGKTCDVCPGAEACKKAGCCAGTVCKDCPNAPACAGKGTCCNGGDCTGNAQCANSTACAKACPQHQGKCHRVKGCPGRPPMQGHCHR